MNPVRLVWNLHTRATVEQAWNLLSDTDRFNRVADTRLHFESEPDPEGGVRHTGWMKKFGMKVRWQELPFQFERPEWFLSERLFPDGPAARLQARLNLSRGAKGGTDVRYELAIQPRNALTWPLVAADARLTVRPQIDKALRKAIAHLDGLDPGYDPAPPALGADESKRLEQRIDGLQPPAVREALLEQIRTAPLFRQNRMSPVALAKKLKLSEELVINAFLDAVRRDVLQLRWELLCPSCQAPKDALDALRTDPGESHCPTCDIHYDGSFPDSVNVSFRPARDIRDFEVAVECLLSPGRTPHVVTQQVVEPGETVVWDLELAAGGYLLLTDPPTGAASIEVSGRSRAAAMTCDLTEDGALPALLRVRPGDVAVALRSRLDHRVHVSLRRRWRPPFTLTAGRLLEIEGARELLPAEALTPALTVEVEQRTIVVVEVLKSGPEVASKVRDVVEAAEPMLIWSGDDHTLATFNEPMAAVRCARALDGDQRLCVAVGQGTILLLDAVPSGSLVDKGLAAAREAGGGRTVLFTPIDLDLPDDVTLKDGLLGFPLVPPEQEDEQVPASVGAYALQDLVGEGGFGRVFAARRIGDGHSCVIKLLRAEIARDPDHTQRFYNEARIASRLAHRNTVRVLDWGHSAAGRLFVAMERLKGHELEEQIEADGTVPWRRAVQIAIEVCAGLQAAHEAGVVHRDIKPANVFLTDDVTKVIDFGIAIELDGDEAADEARLAIGTPLYMAPEQLMGDPLDPRTDVYAVGLTLCRAIAGKLPFPPPPEGSGMRHVFRRIVLDPIPLREITDQDVPAELEAALLKAVSRDADERFQSAREFGDALRTLL